MNVVIAVLLSVMVGLQGYLVFRVLRKPAVAEAVRYAVTLKGNGGEFVALCTEKHRDRWVFEDVKVMPTNPGGPVLKAADGRLYVPVDNILYYQEITNVA